MGNLLSAQQQGEVSGNCELRTYKKQLPHKRKENNKTCKNKVCLDPGNQ
jgi:hypothetical protein